MGVSVRVCVTLRKASNLQRRRMSVRRPRWVWKSSRWQVNTRLSLNAFTFAALTSCKAQQPRHWKEAAKSTPVGITIEKPGDVPDCPGGREIKENNVIRQQLCS